MNKTEIIYTPSLLGLDDTQLRVTREALTRLVHETMGADKAAAKQVIGLCDRDIEMSARATANTRLKSDLINFEARR